MRIPRLDLLALLVVPAPSAAQLPAIVLPNDPMVQEDRVAVNHFIAAFHDLGIDVVDYVEPGEVALEVVVQSVRRADRQFHVVVLALSFVRRFQQEGESRTRPALAVISGSREPQDLIRTMAEDVVEFLEGSVDGAELFDGRSEVSDGSSGAWPNGTRPSPPVRR